MNYKEEIIKMLSSMENEKCLRSVYYYTEGCYEKDKEHRSKENHSSKEQ